MTNGTIHPIGPDLFLIEGEWSAPGPDRHPSTAGVHLSGERLYFLDTGSGPAQRAALRALVASYPQIEDATLLNSGLHSGLTGNNDILDTSTFRRRRHLQPGPIPASAALSTTNEWGTCPDRVPRESYDTFQPAIPLLIGREEWSGWRVDSDLYALELPDFRPGCSARVAFYLVDPGVLLLPAELDPASGGDGVDLRVVDGIGRRVQRAIDDQAVKLVSLGIGRPVDAHQARDRFTAGTRDRSTSGD